MSLSDSAHAVKAVVPAQMREEARRAVLAHSTSPKRPGSFAAPQSMVYLIHLDAPVCPWRPARHYLGTTMNMAARLQEHRSGIGARMLKAASERGIAYDVVRTWAGDRLLERRLKAQKAGPRLCPLCARQSAAAGTHAVACLRGGL